MNSVACVSHIGFRLSHRVTFAGNSSYDGDSRAVKAEVGKTNSAEKLMPFLGGIFRKTDKLVPLLFLRSAHERHKLLVKGGCVDTIAFCGKADRAALQIDVAQRDSGFRDTAALSHRDQPRVIHPRRLFLQCRFNLPLFVDRDFRLLFWRHSFVSEFQARIGVDVVAPDCFLQNGGENFQFCERRIECSCSDKMAWWIGAELGIGSANLVGYLKRRDYVYVVQIGSNRGPGVSVSRQRFRIRVLISKETWHPNIEPVALSISIDVQLAHRVFCGYLFDLSKRTVVVGANLGAFICPGAVWTLISNPVVRACVSLVIRCHSVQHSAAKQNSSMTISLGR